MLPTPSSSLAQRSPRRVREARQAAQPYHSPRRPLGPANARANVRPDAEPERAAQRDKDRERALSQQDTPSRRHRKTPTRRTDENRAVSPTPQPRRPRLTLIGPRPPPPPQPNARSQSPNGPRTLPRVRLILPAPPQGPYPTPPATNNNSNTESNARVDGQRRRRERERHQREAEQQRALLAQQTQYQQPTPPGTQGLRRILPRQQAQPQPGQRAIQPRPAPAPVSRQRQSGSSNRGGVSGAASRGRRRVQVAALPPARSSYTDPDGRHDLGRMDVRCPHCKALHWRDEARSDSTLRNLKFGVCCQIGKVDLEVLREPPAELRALLLGTSAQANEFRKNIAQYNTALSFTSLGVKVDNGINNGGGPYVFRIHGELYHSIGSMLPTEGHAPRYAQLYFYEPQAALDQRMRNNTNLRRDTMAILQRVVNANHRYAAYFKHAKDVLAEEQADNVSIRLRVATGVHVRRGNLPTADEVAVIIPEQEHREPRDIILRRRDGPLQRISELHPAYTPLYYVLSFPFGEDGWDQEMRMRNPDNTDAGRLTQTKYVAYRLHQRDGEATTLLRGGRLLQRYMVDMWASSDQNRLQYLRDHQGKLRAELYQGLADAIEEGDENVDMNSLGKRIVLPSSYGGGPRDRGQRFQDSMALARYYRSVDLFITVTTNPDWVEIKRELFDGQYASDRPDLVARVFEQKKDAIIDDICKKEIFGGAAARVHAIEFQKRGLPHMHLLLFLQPGYKLSTPDDIDSAIRAYWPDPATEPLLFETVKKCMVHGPCGRANPKAPCMENGRCTKGFPKPFTDRTMMDDNGYPKYFRPDDGRAYDVRGVMTDNRWIVPYSPFLLAKYNCHINVECAVSLGSFKYAFKYIQKGGDKAGAQVVNKRDEITRWIEGRYVSAAEAAWRIFHFTMFDQQPKVARLQIHLPGQHMVRFDASDNPQEVLARGAVQQSSLTAFFAANADPRLGPIASQYTYQEMPQRFTLKESSTNTHWAVRQRGMTLGRMYFVPPNAGERFYLRTLLTVVKGPKSFADLRTFNGVEYPDFLGACLARGLLEDDGEWRQCLQEAAEMQTGSRLRQLFATLLMFCEPTRPGVLWEDFRAHICDDLLRSLQRMGRQNATQEEAYDYGLYLLNKLLKESGKSLSDWTTMPQPRIHWDSEAVNPLIADQLDYNIDEQRERAEEQIPLLNPEQRSAFDQIRAAVGERAGRVFFVNGPGGTGKTFVYKTLCYALRSEGTIVLCVASSGIAALLMPGGRTAYSVFKIPIEGLFDGSFCNIPKNSHRAELMRRVGLIIWDEISMQHRHAVEAVDRTLRDLLDKSDIPFGGIPTVLGGDWQQILPVVPKGSREAVVLACIRRSSLWNHITVLRLHRNMRLASEGRDEREFASWLLDIGHGRGMGPNSKVPLRPGMRCNNASSLIDFIYPGVSSTPPPPPEYFLNRMILAPRNADVAEINSTVLNQLAGGTQIYYSADKVIEEAGADGPRDTNEVPVPVEFLRSINSGSLPPGELAIKLGCPLILLRNLSPSEGLCNGTRMVVRRMSNRVLECELVGGDHNGETALIPRISLTPSNTTEFTFKFSRRQFPVRLAFALTINKAQGQSVKLVGLDLRVPVFSHGQLYVAFSRATSGERIRVLLPNNSVVDEAVNVVYPEVLID